MLIALLAVTPLGAAVNDGLLDLSFAPEIPLGQIGSILPVNGGYLVATSEPVLRFRHDGSIDSAFECPFVADASFFSSFTAVRSTPDGGFILAGLFFIGAFDENNPGRPTFQVAKISASGAPDFAFANNWFEASAPGVIVTDCLIDGLGRIYVAGAFEKVNGIDHRKLVRLFPDGTVDPGFEPPSDVAPFHGMALSPDGRLLVVAGHGAERIIRLNENGSIDAVFSSPSGLTGIANISVSTQGRIAFSSSGRILVLRDDGTLDPAFDMTIRFPLPHGLRWSDDRLLVWGPWEEPTGFLTGAGIGHFGILRFHGDGSLDSQWTRSALTSDGTVLLSNIKIRDVRIDLDDSVLVSGDFSSFAGVPRDKLVRLLPGSATEILWFNTSARGFVTASDPLIVGFVVGGNAPQRYLVRGVGESLASFGVTNSLADPVVRVYRGPELVFEGKYWRKVGGIVEATATAGAFALTGLNETAGLLTLPPGAYTLVVGSLTGNSGTALGEVYSLDGH